ncbi:Xanthine dehydrogenase YagR molybdenum-binding subunit OS=Streptomyces violarus OX=67380 GN=FHS41_000649 PE=4 SV=1 [Streptomyces violarus]
MPGVLTVLHHHNAPRVDSDYVGLLGVPPDPSVALFHTTGWFTWAGRWRWSSPRPPSRPEAAEALVVTYDQEPHDVAFSAERQAEAYPVDGHAPGVMEKGDLEAQLASSAVVVDAEYTTPEEYHNPMEPHAATALWEGGRLEVVDSNQGTTWVAGELANLFSLDPASVRVRSEHVGGGFGSKGVRSHQVAAVMAATVLQRPVRVVMTRRQMFSLAGYRSPTAQRVRLGADADGRLRALEHQSLNMTSSVHEFVEPSAAASRAMYDADAHHTASRVVRSTYRPRPGCAPPGRRPARSRWNRRSTSSPSGAASTRSSCACATSPRWARCPGCRSAAAT